ncbi:DUF3592 domain-containing protein [Nocardia sp. NPDC049149]|uniref:DUF3592 domain-containing protein n=1 Tax=Nocardia sp. NPDC049149 TaxID=3364315 RepID=UPI0037200394
MDETFHVLIGLMIAGVLLIIAGFFATIAMFLHLGTRALAQDSDRLRRAWDSGVTAEGRCLRIFTTTSGGGDFRVRTTLHHVYEFTARDGRVIRFEETGGPATRVEGDRVTVYYAEGEEGAATTRTPRRVAETTGTPVLLLAGMGVLLFVLAAFVALYVGFTALVDDPVFPADRNTIYCVDRVCRTGQIPFPPFEGHFPRLGGY